MDALLLDAPVCRIPFYSTARRGEHVELDWLQ
jgi:hypothetical protein